MQGDLLAEGPHWSVEVRTKGVHIINDSQNVIYLEKNSKFHARTKHNETIVCL